MPRLFFLNFPARALLLSLGLALALATLPTDRGLAQADPSPARESLAGVSQSGESQVAGSPFGEPQEPPTADLAAGTDLSAPVLASLQSSKVGDRDAAIQELGLDFSPLSSQILAGLLQGRLHLDRASGAFYLEEEGGFRLLWPETGPSTPENPRKVAVNNRQRETLEGLLNSRALRDPDLERRRRAAAALIGATKVDLALIQNLLTQEADERTRDSLRVIVALGALRDSGSPLSAKLAALQDLEGLYAPAAQADLKLLAQGQEPQLAQAASRVLRRLEARAQHLALVETFFFGLSLGSVLVLIAIGLAITFGVMGVINMAHGEMAMLGAYTVWALQTLWPQSPGLALLLALPTAFVVAGLVGGAIELTVIRPLYQRPLETLLATFGLSLILQQAARKGISSMNVPVTTPGFMSGQWLISSNFSLSQGRVIIILFCLLVFAVVYLIMRKTRLGLEIRAVTQNRAMARALGVPSSRVDTLTFALGSGVAGISGVALSQLTNVGPNLGQDYIVDSFMVVVFGGVGNLWGTLVGGLIIGLANKFLEPLNGAMLAKITIMVGLILFIQRHPRGLFPQRGRVASF
ncbi:MAG: urea ABC transporter permease subunit UrtB [Deltaproteobacteria bacterium]|nr:urea ABC transporter permease subunit UrtB [Deltaproteobacteria bacterium]